MPKTAGKARVTALYERLSRDDDLVGESNSIINQKKYLEDYAHKNGLMNIRHYTDDGYSGVNFNRPGVQALITAVEAGEIDTICVKDLSRFGRNYLQVGFYTEVVFPQKNVRFIAINNGIDSNNATDNDFAPFLNIMNEFYAKDTSNKIKAIFDTRMRDGKRCSGSIPYGYNRLPGDMETEVFLPDFGDGQEQRPIGIWGQRHLRYIREHRIALYSELLTSGRLNAYLADLNEEAEAMLSRLVKQLAKKECVTEKLKAEDGMRWVQAMNNIRNRAAEVVYNDLIYN